MVNKKQVRQMKTTWYARPHNLQTSWAHGLESAVVNDTTIYPLIMYDEGLGSPSTYEANPEHASFVEANEPNCFPESRIDNVMMKIRFSLTKLALETDKLHMVRCAFMMIHTAFKEDLIANDELSGLDISEILELDSETTDRQAYPLWNDVDMKDAYGTTAALLATNVPSLDTNQGIEGVAFSQTVYYDAINYYTNANKLKKVSSGLKWFTLTKNKPYREFNLFIHSKNKFMNPYSFMGCLVHIPGAQTKNQIPIDADTTDVNHVRVDVNARYYEWNGQYNMKRI